MEREGKTIPVCRLRRLRRTELPVDTVELVRYLIGKVAVHDTDYGRLTGRIVETEAYPIGDSAGHAFRGETRRNASRQRLRGGAGLLDLAQGPGRLAQTMRIDLRQNGLDLCAAGPLWLATSRRKAAAIGKSVRIGLTRNVDRKLRFYDRGNPYVNGPKRSRE